MPGAVVSEVAPTMPPLSGMFPQRNRIISGLTLGTIVVEAADRSGALISAGVSRRNVADVAPVVRRGAAELNTPRTES